MTVHTARRAVGWVFAINGMAIATWLSRLPAVRETLDLSPSGLALVLVSGSAGAVLALPLSGPVVHRLGPATTVRAAGLLCLSGIVVAGVAGGGVAGGVPLLAVALFAFGIGNAVWDVGMNVEGTQVEQALGRAILPRFHAAFSLGSVAGAGLGAGAAAVGVPVTVHYLVVAGAVLVGVLSCVRSFLPRQPEPDLAAGGSHHPDQSDHADRPGPPARRGSGALQSWRESRTLMLGLLALGMAMAEGSAYDWLAIAMVDGYGVSHAVGAGGYAVFVVAMTLVRLAGPALLDRYGRVLVLRAGAVLALAGVLVFVAGGRLVDGPGLGLALVVASVGALAWGFGVALGFPVAMSAAADDPARAAARVSVVASLGYVAFLVGPPFLGFLGDRFGVLPSLLAVSVAVVLSLTCAGAARAATPAR